ncbi:two-component system sensor histidine kinase NtrB [Aquabacterium sp.]|uniref:two-component system sensor histidine kinase NtrB n=1 Tax=Aquabacterium sp. TaxID=1872578 RepID=UPI003B6BC166
MLAKPLDFNLPELQTRQSSALSRRAMVWLVGMLLLAAFSIVVLALFLSSVEREDDERQRVADAQWLDQSMRFHFRRLERDLQVQAMPAVRGAHASAPDLRLGELWRAPGVVRKKEWVAVDQPLDNQTWPTAIHVMLDTAKGLQRAAFAGPLTDAKEQGHFLWVAVPLIERGVHMGTQLAVIDLDEALNVVVPAWYLDKHRVSVVNSEAVSTPVKGSVSFLAHVQLPGAQLALQVEPLVDDRTHAPRVFFGVALICLGGMTLALSLLWRDMARRQQVEAQLQTQMALRAAMERSVTLGLRAWDVNGRLLYVNQAFCAMVGIDAATLLQSDGAQPYWPDAEWDEFHVLQQRMAIPLEQQVGAEMTLRHFDGRPIDVLVHGAPLVMADGQVVGWMSSVLDITERKRVERLAARQQEMLEASGRLIAVGEVASTLAHELNQPLGALSSFANGLLNRLHAERITLQDVIPVVERMERIAEKAGKVIQRVNAFARRQEMNRQPLALNSFVDRVSRGVPLPDGMVLDVSLPERDCVLPADALLLEHALHNVVLNATEWAAHGMQQPARVHVSVRIEASMVGLCVEDSGPGVPPDQLGTIFDAFATRKAGGMGMGLSICRSIIEAHHGRVEVARSAELNGAQFTLWLPLDA